VGGILSLGLQGPPGGWRAAEGRTLLDRFSPVALGAFALTIVTGIGRGFQELGSLGDLVRTAYGATLLVKVLAVLVMTQLSLLAWRRIVGSPRAEAALALGVIAIAALLAAYPLPPNFGAMLPLTFTLIANDDEGAGGFDSLTVVMAKMGAPLAPSCAIPPQAPSSSSSGRFGRIQG